MEDAAEAHGASHHGQRVGGIGDCAAFSFFGNKIVTTGEGGMVTTDDDKLAERLRLFRGQGLDPSRREGICPECGETYTLDDIRRRWRSGFRLEK